MFSLLERICNRRLERLAAQLMEIELPKREVEYIIQDGRVIGIKIFEPTIEDIAHLIVRGNLPSKVRKEYLRRYEKPLREMVRKYQRKNG